MIFYQYTTSTVSIDNIMDTIMKGTPSSSIIDLHFYGSPNVNSLEDALFVIDKKRQNLINPYQHSFLVIEPIFFSNPSRNSALRTSNDLEEALNTYFKNDLYILSLVYLDNQKNMHSIVVLSDIEISLPESTQNRLTADILYDIILSSFPDANIDSINYDSIYVFNGKDTDLEYDGVVHLKFRLEN